MDDSLEKLSFESALQELEQLVGKMENGGLSLDELVKGFERGRLLSEHCRKQLDSLERKISLLSRDDGGNGEWRDFESAAGNTASPASARSAAVDNDDVPF